MLEKVSSHEGAEKICRLRVREANQYHVRAAAFATDITKSSIKLETEVDSKLTIRATWRVEQKQ